MKRSSLLHHSPSWSSFAVVFSLVFLCAANPVAPSVEKPESEAIALADLSSDEMVRRALADSLYYDYEKWFALFKDKVKALESAPPTLANKMELMKYYFFLAGLYTEYSHTLAFTSKFSVASVKKDFEFYIKQTKAVAREILDRPGLGEAQKADAYLYLGASEGYLGIFEYGAGRFINALINGFQADNHLEKALEINPDLLDAHLGLGIYRYGNSRLGGMGNFIMQGGKDRRREGVLHVERAIKEDALTRPLALKTLAWFYISEQINPKNRDLALDHPMSKAVCRKRAKQVIKIFEDVYFKPGTRNGFVGNKDLAMMKAIQYVLDGEYSRAGEEFENIIAIANYLKQEKNYPVNPQLIDTARQGKLFSDLMVGASSPEGKSRPSCVAINKQIDFLDGGGSFVDYDFKKIQSEIQDVFYNNLTRLSGELKC